MKFFEGATCTLFLSASLMLAASLPSQNITGNYMEARTADVYTGPCFANAETGLVGQLAVMGWKVSHGSWQGVDLSGLSVVGVIRAQSTLGNVEVKSNPAKAVLIIDSKADPAQRETLLLEEQLAWFLAHDFFPKTIAADQSYIGAQSIGSDSRI